MLSALDSASNADARIHRDETVDREQLATLRLYEGEAGANLLEELIESFLSGLPRYLTEIREAIANGCPERLSFAAHSLRGSCGTFGAVRLMGVCERLELLARAFAREEACAVLPDLEVEAARLADVLAKERG